MAPSKAGPWNWPRQVPELPAAIRAILECLGLPSSGWIHRSYLAEWPLPDAGGPRYQSPQALAADAGGFLYVSDIAGDRIYKLQLLEGVAK